jgi:glutamate transport system substrate-binding protein
MARRKAAGKVTVGTKFDQPLFGLKNLEGKPEGFDVEIAKLIAGEMGISPDNITWVETVSANREPFIQQGKVDFVVATYTINDKRKKVVDFAGPYYQAGQDIMVAKGNPLGITGPESLAGKRVCSVSGSTPAENIKTNYPQAKLTEFDVYSKCAEALKNKQVDAVTTDNVILLGLISNDQDTFELVGKPFTKEPYGVGMKKGDTAFRTFVNDVLAKVEQDGRWLQAWSSTAGKVAEGQPTPPAIDRYWPPDLDAVLDNLDLYRQGFLTTLALASLSAVLALALGTLLAAMRVSPVPPLRWAGATYVEIVRNTPLTVVFFFTVFVLPQIGITLSFFVCAVVALTVYHAAFFCEAVRSGINSVAAGQAEAARSIGLTFGQSLRLVILPQAFRTVIPPIINVAIALIKNTSIAAAFGVLELTGVSQSLSNANSDQVIPLLLGVAVCYLVITLPAGWLAGVLERRVAFSA